MEGWRVQRERKAADLVRGLQRYARRFGRQLGSAFVAEVEVLELSPCAQAK